MITSRDSLGRTHLHGIKARCYPSNKRRTDALAPVCFADKNLNFSGFNRLNASLYAALNYTVPGQQNSYRSAIVIMQLYTIQFRVTGCFLQPALKPPSWHVQALLQCQQGALTYFQIYTHLTPFDIFRSKCLIPLLGTCLIHSCVVRKIIQRIFVGDHPTDNIGWGLVTSRLGSIATCFYSG